MSCSLILSYFSIPSFIFSLIHLFPFILCIHFPYFFIYLYFLCIKLYHSLILLSFLQFQFSSSVSLYFFSTSYITVFISFLFCSFPIPLSFPLSECLSFSLYSSQYQFISFAFTISFSSYSLFFLFSFFSLSFLTPASMIISSHSPILFPDNYT